MYNFITNTMSKTFETNALKGKSLAAGMKKRIAELQKYGVKEADLTAMEQDADKAIEMIREVDSLREEVTRKLQAANEQLNSLRDRASVYRKIIKSNYLQDQWLSFGHLRGEDGFAGVGRCDDDRTFSFHEQAILSGISLATVT